MQKLSPQRQQHHRKRHLPKHPNYFEQVERQPSEEHPVDVAVARRVDQKAARKRIQRLQQQVLDRLGDDKQPMLELESLLDEVRSKREATYFNLGYEHGLSEALARGRRGSTRLSQEAAAFAKETRERLTQAQLPPRQAMLGLLECLWGVAFVEQDAHQGQWAGAQPG
jgi:hypothetical protein